MINTHDSVVIEAPEAFKGETGDVAWTDGRTCLVKFHRIACSAVFDRSELRVLKEAA